MYIIWGISNFFFKDSVNQPEHGMALPNGLGVLHSLAAMAQSLTPLVATRVFLSFP